MNLKRISLIALALVMVCTTCMGAFASIDFTIGGKDAQYAILGEQAGLCMNVGSDETERNFAWYSTHDTGSIEYALRNGDTFPATYATVETIASPAANSFVHRATIYDLKPDSEYVYRIKNGGKVSQNYYFTTDSAVEFDFVFAGDPQIGASYNNTRDGQNWGKTVDFVKNNFPEISLFVSAGDQVNCGNDEGEYEAFLSPNNLPTFALAPTVGNHEDAYATDEYPDLTYAIFSEHYNLPNRYIDGKLYGKTTAGSDYWYTYNNVLFIHINTNNHSAAEHESFIKNAVESNPNVTWKFIVQHFAFFGSHYFIGDAINERRNTYGPMYQKYGIDMVLNGHEHDLVRSHMINYSDTGYTYTDVGNSVTDPSGIFYLTACSSSSSKFYTLEDAAKTPHIAFKDANKQTVTYCQVTANTFKFTTYDVLNNVVLDTFQITKTNGISNAYDTNVALGKTYSNDPLYIKDGDTTPRYPDEGATMTDGKSAPTDAIYKDEAFMAFYKHDSYYKSQGYASITVDLGQNYDLQRFVAQVGTTKCTSGIVAPASMSVYVSDDKSTWTKAGECTITDSTTDSCIPASVNLDNSVNGRYVQYRFVAHETSVFVMVAEVEAYTAHTHVEGEMKVVRNATATGDGRSETRCTQCGMVVNYEITPAFNRDPNNRNRALSKPYTTSGFASKYPDEGDVSLTDGIYASADAIYSDVTYAGFSKNNDTFFAENGYFAITLDLKQTYMLDKFVTDVATAYATAGVTAPGSVAFYVSNDSTNWTHAGTTQVTDTTEVSHLLVSLELEKAVTARYVQYRYFLGAGNMVWVAEVEAHEAMPSEDSDEKTNLAYSKSYTTKGIYTVDGVASYPDENGKSLTDGKDAPYNAKYNDVAFTGFNKQTSEYTAQGYASITVDLGAEYKVDEFVTRIGTAALSSGIYAPSSVSVYVSTDNATWTAAGTAIPVESYEVSNSHATLLISPAVTARYVQFRVVGGSNWMMISEVEVYEALPEEEEPAVMKGDLNGNGEIDSIDYSLLKRLYFGGFACEDPNVYDINNNGEMDSIDYSLLKRVYFGVYSLN